MPIDSSRQHKTGRMKVLYVIDSVGVGGAETSLLNISSRFSTVDPVVCHLYPRDYNDLKSDFREAGTRVISLDIRKKRGYGEAVWRVHDVVQQEKPDVIHGILFNAEVVARLVARMTGIPLVGSFVNDSYSATRRRGMTLKRRVKLRLVQAADALTARWVDHFVSISETVKRSNARALRIPLDRISVIFRGRNPTPFIDRPEGEEHSLRSALGLTEDASVVLNVARLLYRKGQEELIAGFARLKERRPDAHLLIAGEGPDRSQVEAVIDRLGTHDYVHLLGRRNDVAALLNLADVFAFPSHYEGHGGALIEAMFAERPIVASDTAVHRESVTHGETARLVSLKDPAALAQGIEWMLDHPEEARQYGQRAREVAMERFHIDKIAAQHEAFYEKILRES